MYGSARKTCVESLILLLFFVTIFQHKRPKHINARKCKRSSSLILSLGRSAIFLHLTHFDITDLTTMLSPMTPKQDIMTWLIVMPLPAFATWWSWHLLTIKFVILQSLGNSTRCWILSWIGYFCILPPINTPYASTYGSSLKNLLFASIFSTGFDYWPLIISICALCISLQFLCNSCEGSLFFLTDLNSFLL